MSMDGWRKLQLRDAVIRQGQEHKHARPPNGPRLATEITWTPRRIWAPEPPRQPDENGYYHTGVRKITLPRITLIEKYDEKGNPR